MALGRAYGLVHGKADAELLVAVKTLKEGSSTETKEDFFKEVALMSLLHHDNIVELLAVSTEEEPYGMIFEFMEHGDLNQYLRKAGPFFEGEEKEKGLIFLKKRKIGFCSGAHNPERATSILSCHGVFIDQFIFRTTLACIYNIF